MASTASEFRQRNQKDIVLPSGLAVKIRKLSPFEFLALGKMPLNLATTGDAEAVKQQVTQAIKEEPEMATSVFDTVVCKGIVAPKVTADPKEASEEVLHISELGDDLMEAFDAIMEFAGYLSAEKTRPFSTPDGQL